MRREWESRLGHMQITRFKQRQADLDLKHDELKIHQ